MSTIKKVLLSVLEAIQAIKEYKASKFRKV